MDYFRNECFLNITRKDSAITFFHGFTKEHPDQQLLHVADTYEIYIYISGDCNYIVESKAYELEKGDIIVINPHHVHKVNLHSHSDYERFYFHIPADTFENFPVNPVSLLSNKYHNNNILRLNDEFKERILELLYRMSRFATLETNTALLMFTSIFFEFLSTVNHEKGQSNELIYPKASSKISPIVAGALKYLTKNFSTLKSISEIADHLGVAPAYLSHLFKKSTGTTIVNYLRALRISYSKELLELGKNATQACYECGFNDYSHFIQIFKATTGLTPKQYQQHYYEG